MQAEFLREITQHKEDEEGKQHETRRSTEPFETENSNAVMKASSGVLGLISFDDSADGRAIRQNIEQRVDEDTLIGTLGKELRRKTNGIHLMKHTLEERNKDIVNLHATVEMPE